MAKKPEPVPADLDRYEYHNGNSNKFWMIKQYGKSVATWYGKCGKPPRDGVIKSMKGWKTEEIAAKFVKSKVKQKKNGKRNPPEGYTIVGKGYNPDNYDKDGIPKVGEPPVKKMKLVNKYIPFAKFKKDYSEGVKSIKKAAMKFGKALVKGDGEPTDVLPEGLRKESVRINADNCDKVSDALKVQLEILRQAKFLDPSRESIKPLKEAFEDQDFKSVTVQEFSAAGGLELAHWTGGGGGNDYHWLLLKTEGNYVQIADGCDNGLEWGCTGLQEEDDYEEDMDEEEEDARDSWLNKFLILRYPDDADMFMEDDEDFEEIMEDM
mmetsp:Transcript_24070/g.44315  ORF Transcript_24070/g.44315 Transcript_24070/m.44315 type:complete len:322 (-) Transcript_24070:117-1082(-)